MDRKKIVRLILGDQLNERHSWFQQVSEEVTYVLMEVRQETDYVEHHIQKVAGIFAAMRNFASVLEKKGHQVLYLPLDDPENGQTFEHNLKRLIRTHGFDCLEYQLPDEYRLDRQLRGLGGGLSIPVRAVDTEHFLTEREEVKKFFEGKKRYLMESFYRGMRRKHGILMEDGDPIGGRWNYDQENRNPYDDAVKIPEPKLFANDVRELTAMIEAAGVRTFGQIEPRLYVWPVSRSQALQLLDDFLRNGGGPRLLHHGRGGDVWRSRVLCILGHNHHS